MKEEHKSYYSPVREPVKKEVINNRDMNRCISCGIQDKRIEAGGIWHCPNPLCTVTGAWGAREAFNFHQLDTQDSEGIMPTEEFVALRGWAKRMVESAIEQKLTLEDIQHVKEEEDMHVGRS